MSLAVFIRPGPWAPDRMWSRNVRSERIEAQEL